MIPGLLASEVAAALREFIVAGFETETPPFAGEFQRLVEEQLDGEAFVKGPYLSIGLPFKKGRETRNWFAGFQTNYPPFLHQQQAWQRLASDKLAQNTLVATGTGSGKTECFLYPLLDHCQRAGGPGIKAPGIKAPGIKAIVIYPMNALATDQAKRFADIIHHQQALNGLRVGLFVGGNDESPFKTMMPDRVISCKETMRSEPPDILLTNYKMLDYLLMRPKDQALWEGNNSETLKYLVVDELHTFDGAQGTDLALLIRRLRARLNIPEDHLICAGTSATLGSQDNVEDLVKYAGEIFASPFSEASIIAEQRLAVEEFIGVLEYLHLNPELNPDLLMTASNKGLESFIDIAHQLFFLEPPEGLFGSKEGRIELGRKLRCHGQVQNILRQQQDTTLTLQDLAVVMQRSIKGGSPDQAAMVVQGLLALLAWARDENGQPLEQLRVQLWTRELRRIVARLAHSSDSETVMREGGDEASQPLLWFAVLVWSIFFLKVDGVFVGTGLSDGYCSSLGLVHRRHTSPSIWGSDYPSASQARNHRITCQFYRAPAATVGRSRA